LILIQDTKAPILCGLFAIVRNLLHKLLCLPRVRLYVFVYVH
jgi:hypothetical protein